MVSAGDFKNGLTIQMDNNIWQIIEFQHVKPGKGAAFVRTKMKNIVSGGVVEKTFRPTEKLELAHIDRKEYQYLYSDGDLYNFMDTETWEQIPINKSVLGDNFKFVKENMVCKVLSYKGNVFGIEPPNFVELKVTKTDLRVTQHPTLQSLQLLKQVLKLKFLSLLMRAKLFRSTQEQANIWAEHNFCGRISYESY